MKQKIIYPNKIERQKTQREIYEWMKSFYNGELVLNERKLIYPKELDFYFPELKLAIEFDGILYHSFGIHKSSKFNNYMKEDPKHLLWKTEECQKQGIRLIHIWDFEWKNDREGIKSFLKSVIEETEEFLDDTIIFDRRFAPIEIPGYLVKYGQPQKYNWNDRVYYDCGIAVFEKTECLQ
jgi:very-short-patch-repair endonuclease